MSLERLIVGYPEGDPRIALLWEENGHVAVPHRGCISCGVMTYFVPSGADAIRSRDPEPVCDRCWQHPATRAAIEAEL